MRNISDESCRGNQNTHFMFSNFSSKIAPFMRECRKVWWGQRGYKWRHNTPHTRWMLNKQGYTHTSPHARDPHARSRTHRRICNTYFFSTATMTRECASMLCYTYIVCLVEILLSVTLTNLHFTNAMRITSDHFPQQSVTCSAFLVR